MADHEDEVPGTPATWENVAVGKAKEVVGRVVGDAELTEDGAEQEEIAHEVREEFKEEHQE